MRLMGFLVFVAVMALLMGLAERKRRNRLKEEIARATRRSQGARFFAQGTLSTLWRVSEHTPLNYEKAFILGLSAAVVAFFVVFSMMPGVTANLLVIGTMAAVGAFAGIPYVHNQALLYKVVKGFQEEIEFGVATMVHSLESTQGDITRALEEVGRVAQGVVGTEFRLMADHVRDFKKTAADAFGAMAMRVPCQESRDLADAAELYERVGGEGAIRLFKHVGTTIADNKYTRDTAYKTFRSLKRGAAGIIALSIGVTLVMISQSNATILLFSSAQGRSVLALAALIDVIAIMGIRMLFNTINLP